MKRYTLDELKEFKTLTLHGPIPTQTFYDVLEAAIEAKELNLRLEATINELESKLFFVPPTKPKRGGIGDVDGPINDAVEAAERGE